MIADREFLDRLAATAASKDGPLVLAWPARGNLGGFRSFETVEAWKECLLDLSLHPLTPQIVSAKFRRAQKLYLLAWIDQDLIPAGELIALTALELALNDRYGDRVAPRRKPRKPKATDKPPMKAFANLLLYMVQGDGLTNEKVPMVQRYGGNVIPFLTGEAHPTLAEIRNDLAHGYPFDRLPRSGLLELVRDLIDYAHRGFIAEQQIFSV